MTASTTTVLERLNFGQVFKRWVKLLYTGCNGVIRVNGRYTDPTNIKSGVRQGCPLSAILVHPSHGATGLCLKKQQEHGIPVPGSSGRQAKLALYMASFWPLAPK